MTDETMIDVTDTEEDNEAREAAEIREAFDSAIDNGDADEDDVKLEMITAGASFKNVTRLYNKFMEEAGLVLSKDQKGELAADAMGANDVSTEEGFDTAVAEIVEAGAGKITQRSAAGMVRARAKKEKVEFFKKPKKAVGNRTTFLSEFYDALLENPNMTEVEAHDFIVEHGTANTLRWETAHQRVRILLNRLADKYAS